jgi:hypothetical protein
MAVAGLVFGILAIVIAFVPCIGILAIIPAILGIIFSIVGLVKSRKTGQGKGMAVAGLILSILAIIWVPVLVFLILGGAAAAGAAGTF